ncbi:MAG: RIP metalloprotease RseP [Candidatus Marinimicrobia bacterium]|jgi:regulator of sigma E protease|nr:RIP metalloprotease RseP [Candidatus Neomarinimicrobiota bacterium]
MIYILAFIVLIGVIVFVHELGHYLAARSVGVGVERFSIGMPPNFVDFTKTKKGLIIDIYFFVLKNGKVKWQKIYSTTLSSFNTPSETIFTIGLLPLGGYVKMKGILDESMDSEFKGEKDELESKNSLQKIWVMSAGVIMNLILTFFVFTLIGNLQGDTKIENPNTTIDYIVPDQPAYNAGLQVGDSFIAIEGANVDSWYEAVGQIEKYPNETITISFNRQGETLNKQVTLGARPDLTSGRVDREVGALGISKNQVPVELNFTESLVYGLNETKWAMTLMTSSLKMIFQGNVSRDEVGSVIMIGDMAGQAAQAGLVPFLFLMALISVNLAYINILPIPGLDGGHIALILVESLLGRKLSVKTRIRIQSVGMFILLSLMVFLLLNDIIRVLF